ncbi:MAG: N-acetyl sugar amidotransferase [Flavobacteriales bacterium]|nr:N-acetyl sugar amidotransferase [Flavobacteriales bacterium]
MSVSSVFPMVIVSGFEKDIVYKQCTRCVADSTIPGIQFDTNDWCSLCDFHDKLDAIYPENNLSLIKLEKRLKKIRESGKNKPYDCIIGISGGRDSTYLLYVAVQKWNLRPLAVHFNDGFDNPVAGENMLNAVKKLGVELRTITSDFRECKDLKIVDLKASTPLLNNGTDVGIGAALYGVAYQEKIKTILYGQSFRTEGIRPLAWAYFDGDHLRALHKQFGTYPLSPWKPEKPGYNLGIKEMLFYTFNGIKTFAPFYLYPYDRGRADEILKKELDWVYPGAHYFDDLYWSLITYIHRVKFNIDFRRIAYSALVRSEQMNRDAALDLIAKPYVIEDEKVIQLCIKRLGLSRDEFDSFLKAPPKNFWDYPNSYALLRAGKIPIWVLSRLGFITKVAYEKYFGLPFR